mmetsp:Transcript_86143/g.217067  ORF Transcript_86143/g.217067 Transcript_86143/m.217067 type:complete len:123 (+) Transcript_86143:101-469(+)
MAAACLHNRIFARAFVRPNLRVAHVGVVPARTSQWLPSAAISTGKAPSADLAMQKPGMKSAQQGLGRSCTKEDTNNVEVASKASAVGILAGDADMLCLMEDVAWLLRPMPTVSLCSRMVAEP